MSNRTLIFLTGLVLVAVAVLMITNVLTLFRGEGSERYLSRNGVRGIAVAHNDKLYTLNFEQQNQMIDWINRSVPIGTPITPTPVNFEKIVIYRFDVPDIEIFPIAYVEDNLIFSAANWEEGTTLQDVSRGKLKELIDQTYDQ